MYNINEKEKEIMFNILKRLPGYDTFMIDKNGNDLYVGDIVKIFMYNNEDYILGTVCYNEDTEHFCIDTQEGYITPYLYFEKIKVNDKAMPYVLRERIEKDETCKIKKLSRLMYNNLIATGKYKELYEKLLDFENKKLIKLSNKERSLFDKIIKNEKFTFTSEIALNIKTFNEIQSEEIFSFLNKNLKTIKNKIELAIDREYKNTKFYYEGQIIINEIYIDWTYNILKNRCDILTIEISEFIGYPTGYKNIYREECLV